MKAGTTTKSGADAKGGAHKQIPLDSAMMTAIVAVAAVGVVMAIGALIGFGWREGVGVALGGLVATVNLWIFAVVIRGVLSGGGRRRLWGLAGALKFLALVLGAYLLLRANLATGLTLAVGYAALPLGVALSTFFRADDGDADGADDPGGEAGDSSRRRDR